MKNQILKAVCLLSLSVSWGQTQTDSLSVQFLDEVVLSDTKFESKRSESGKTVIRIDREELSRFEGKSALEIINLKSGVEIVGSRSRVGEVPGVFIRGGRGRQTIVYVDGSRVNDPSSFVNTYDLRLLDASSLESIEIVKGANSTLYGAGAASGVIFITTRNSGNEKIAARISASVGTHQTAEDQDFRTNRSNHAIQLGGSSGKLRYGVEVNHSYADGISSLVTETNEEDKNAFFSAGFNFGIDPNEKWSIDLKARYTELDSDYDETFGFVDAPYTFISKQKGVFLNSKYNMEKGEVRFNAGYNRFESENISAFPSMFEGENLTFDLFTKQQLSTNLSGIFGLNLNTESAELAETQRFTVFDPYTTLQWDVTPNFRLNAGARLNTHSEYDSEWVYSVNPVYRIIDGPTQLKALGSYARSYITPTLNQLFGAFGANPELEPELNRTLEFGLEVLNQSNIRASVLYFDREEENFVLFDNANFQFINAMDLVEVNGVEVEAFWRVEKRTDLQANYTFTQRRGDNAIRIPKHKAFLQLGYAISDNSQLTLQYAYTGKRTDTDFNIFSDVELDPFSLINASYSLELVPDKFRLFAHIDNLFNKEFEEVIGFSTLGRNVRLGFNLNIQ